MKLPPELLADIHMLAISPNPLFYQEFDFSKVDNLDNTWTIHAPYGVALDVFKILSN
jgi:hypothetical protein